jgi:hypothetical protein
MSQNKKWYKWPEGYTDLVPWYKIVLRVAVSPIQLVGFSLLYTSTYLGYGLRDAEQLRKQLF